MTTGVRCLIFLFGTDKLSRELCLRTVYDAGISLSIGLRRTSSGWRSVSCSVGIVLRAQRHGEGLLIAVTMAWAEKRSGRKGSRHRSRTGGGGRVLRTRAPQGRQLELAGWLNGLSPDLEGREREQTATRLGVAPTPSVPERPARQRGIIPVGLKIDRIAVWRACAPADGRVCRRACDRPA